MNFISALASSVLPLLLGNTPVSNAYTGASARGAGVELTTVCSFQYGPRAGTRLDFAPFGVQPIPVGQSCQDGQGSFGVAVAGKRPAVKPPVEVDDEEETETEEELTTVCSFKSGPRAGTRFDFAPFGVQPIPVGESCTDGRGSFGVAVAGRRR